MHVSDTEQRCERTRIYEMNERRAYVPRVIKH